MLRRVMETPPLDAYPKGRRISAAISIRNRRARSYTPSLSVGAAYERSSFDTLVTGVLRERPTVWADRVLQLLARPRSERSDGQEFGGGVRPSVGRGRRFGEALAVALRLISK